MRARPLAQVAGALGLALAGCGGGGSSDRPASTAATTTATTSARTATAPRTATATARRPVAPERDERPASLPHGWTRVVDTADGFSFAVPRGWRAHRVQGGELLARDDEHVGVRRRLAEHAEVALVAHDQPRLGDREPGAQVRCPQLLGAGQHDGADPEAREHREHPLGPVAHERHHHVLAPDPAGRERSRGARRGLRDLAEAPLSSRAVAPERDERPPRGRGGVDHVAGEVHPAWSVDRFVSDQTARSSNGVSPR